MAKKPKAGKGLKRAYNASHMAVVDTNFGAYKIRPEEIARLEGRGLKTCARASRQYNALVNKAYRLAAKRARDIERIQNRVDEAGRKRGNYCR